MQGRPLNRFQHQKRLREAARSRQPDIPEIAAAAMPSSQVAAVSIQVTTQELIDHIVVVMLTDRYTGHVTGRGAAVQNFAINAAVTFIPQREIRLGCPLRYAEAFSDERLCQEAAEYGVVHSLYKESRSFPLLIARPILPPHSSVMIGCGRLKS